MDIESHNDSESVAKNETSMWLGCYIDEHSRVEDERSYFYSMGEFLDRLEEESRPTTTEKRTRKKNNIVIYIYNLSFEWSFLLPEVLKRGLTWQPLVATNSESAYSSVSNKSCSRVWQVSLKFGRNNGLVLLRDLAQIFGGGLDNVAKSFNLPTQKGEIDYRLNRLHGHVVTAEEKEYCFKDTRIIIDILEKMLPDRDFWNAISMASYSLKKMLKFGYPHACKPYMQFRKGYPELDQEETEFLRGAIEGGITYAPDRFQFKVITDKIAHIDAHQMHPSSAFFHLFPYGKGTYFKGYPPLGYISCCRIRISYDDVKLHSIIKLIGLPFIEDKEITVWDFEIPVMKECYVNLEIEYLDGYAYRAKPLPWRNYYADNYRKRLEAKKRKDAFLTLYYKLLNNSSYGKLLEHPHNIYFQNIINELGLIDSEIVRKDEDELRLSAKYTYIPVGACIPAYSKVALIKLALKIGWEKIVYFDTDSIFFLWDTETEKVWNETNQVDFLGGWGFEEFIDRAQFTAPKRYKTETNGRATIKSAGINFDEYKARKYNTEFNKLLEQGIKRRDALAMINLSFEEVNIISSSWKVQRAYRVRGGTLIEFENKDMRVQPKYEPIYIRNVEHAPPT